jgi:lipopolysaccharide transport system permease protein
VSNTQIPNSKLQTVMGAEGINPQTSNSEANWLFEISPQRSKFQLNLKEIYQYRDLLILFIRRDIVSVYKQTVLGPLWFFIQPIFTSLTQFIIFGKIASIPSDGVPYFLFVLAGNTLWSYFSISFTGVADTFRSNQGIFGKVYFPRAIMPIAITASNLFKFGIQFILFLAVLFYSMYSGANAHPNIYILFTPVIILAMALISMGFGMVITSLTTKYRDFTFLLGFGVTLFMYVTPVVYPTSLFLSKVSPSMHWLIYANPLTGLFDLFKYAFLGEGILNWLGIAWSGIFAIVIYLLGLVVFNKTEKSFMDTI